MKDKATKLIIKSIVVFIGVMVMIGFWYGVREVTRSGLDTTPSLTTADYKRVAVKACVKEATFGNAITEQDANIYCQCTAERIYGNKSLEEMRKIDADFIKNGLSEKYDQVVLDCIELIEANYQ